MKLLNILTPIVLLLSLVAMIACDSVAKDENPKAKPLKGILITGGGFHDYKAQKDIITEGIASRLPVEWEVVFKMKQDEMKTYLSEKGWADKYDFVIYNHCFANENDIAFVDSLAAIHHEGKPAIALHCSMHSNHWKIAPPKEGEKTWPKMLGVSSKGHGPKKAITVKSPADQPRHAVLADIPEDWKTPEGELYNVQKVLDGTTVVAYGENGVAKEPQACIWVHEYGKSRVFGTTLGHHNSTMITDEYLTLLSNAVKWITE